MKNYYLTTVTVQIPREGTVIRNRKTVEYQLDRTYASEDRSTRVRRKVIGKVDPLQTERMFPSEAYFELFPDNEVPEDVRDEFLRECAIKREMRVIRQNPEEVIDGVVRGLDYLAQRAGESTESGGTVRTCGGGTAGTCGGGTAGTVLCVPHTCNAENRPLVPPLREEGRSGAENRSFVSPLKQVRGDTNGTEGRINCVMVRRMFDEVYYAMEALADKTPDTVADGYKVRRINEVLQQVQESLKDENRHPFLRLIDEPEEVTDKDGNIWVKGLTYSDILIALKWYKVLPR